MEKEKNKAKTNRDNFSNSVINKLKARVANRCSNPDCRVPTSAPSGEDKVNNIGIAAHICAASTGGPRFDATMTPEKRKSINNAIWLCANCSINIDKDVEKYTVELLKEWKNKAENTARTELGKKLPSNNETIDTAAAALTGLPNGFMVNAIPNIHRATEKSLESLDDRFSIKTSHKDGITSFDVYAKENVQLSMKLNKINSRKYSHQFRQLFEHGDDFEVSSENITIEGSKLIEQLFGMKNGTIKLSSGKLKAVQKLWLVQKETNNIETFDDIQGEISLGIKSFSFQGSACNHAFLLNYKKYINEKEDNSNFTISLCFDQWERLPIRYLPYLDTMLSFFSKMAQGWELFTSLQINGLKVLSGVMGAGGLNNLVNFYSFLHYIKCCNIISEALNIDTRYTSNFTYSPQKHQILSEISETFEGKKDFNITAITSNPVISLIANENCGNIKTLSGITAPFDVQIVETDNNEIEIFGTNIILPPRIINFISILPKIHGEISNIKAGDTVKVELLPQSDFRYTVSYDIK